MDYQKRKGDYQKQRKSQSHPPMNPITRRKRRSSIYMADDRLTRRKRRSSVNMTDDRLSQLPDELLISILSSSLTLKEAARTSILSKRWKSLWTFFYGFLDFDFHSYHRFKKPCYFNSYTLIEEYASDCINYVNKVLTCHQGFGTVPINKLRICWTLRNEYKSIIDSWVDFAMKKRVQHFELDLCSPDYKVNYKFPHGIGFPNLTVLQLRAVDLTDETLAYLISSDKCPSLQHLSVKYAPSLVHVKVVGNSKLKSLEFSICRKMKHVEISSAVNLVSFGFEGGKDTKITFEDVPSLMEATFGSGYCEKILMQPLSSPLSQLEVLVLQLLCFNYLQTMSQSSPKFDRIKRLELQAYMPYEGSWNVCVMTMIYRCPRLQKISLKMNYIGVSGVTRALHQKIHYKHPHECLQAVEFKGWNGDEDDLELMTIILKNTVLLDKVTIDPCTIFPKFQEINAKFCYQEFHIHDKEREKDARKAAEKLRRILPRRVSLVIL